MFDVPKFSLSNWMKVGHYREQVLWKWQYAVIFRGSRERTPCSCSYYIAVLNLTPIDLYPNFWCSGISFKMSGHFPTCLGKWLGWVGLMRRGGGGGGSGLKLKPSLAGVGAELGKNQGLGYFHLGLVKDISSFFLPSLRYRKVRPSAIILLLIQYSA